MKSLQKRATIYFDSELHRVLRIKAAETDQPISKIINDAVRRSLAEDAEDLAAFEERAKEPTLSFEAVVKDLRKRGKL
jgi:predicted transcriptional regulator